MKVSRGIEHRPALRLTQRAERAQEAPVVRRVFSSSPRDPRYHMLSHMSAKFTQPAKEQVHEPRAALFLNRFTRTLSIMYATTGIQDVIGISAENMQGRSFYYCIAENCLRDATKCIENAKGNDSIAYLRFWFRDPRQDDPPAPPDDDSDEEMTTDASVDTSEGGVGLASASNGSATSPDTIAGADAMDIDSGVEGSKHGSNSSGNSTATADTHEAIFGDPPPGHSSASSAGPSPERSRSGSRPQAGDAIELEAVISCTSDGLVVCLRKARPMIPHPTSRPAKPAYENGLYAAPWANEPMLPRPLERAGAGFGTAFAPSLGPQGAHHNHVPPPRSLDQSDFMSAIRDQAVFAWALTGINGSLADFGKGKPLGESLPQDGLPIWASDPRGTPVQINYPSDRSAHHIFGDPGIGRGSGSGSGSGSESRSSGSGNGGNVTPYPGPV